jgi:hypothetical protein
MLPGLIFFIIISAWKVSCIQIPSKIDESCPRCEHFRREHLEYSFLHAAIVELSIYQQGKILQQPHLHVQFEYQREHLVFLQPPEKIEVHSPSWVDYNEYDE